MIFVRLFRKTLSYDYQRTELKKSSILLYETIKGKKCYLWLIVLVNIVLL